MESKQSGIIADAVRSIASLAAIAVGLFLVFVNTPAALADAVFVGSIALLLAIWLWPGATKGQSRVIAVVLILLAAYAFVRGFEWLELSRLRQLGGITAIVMGVILLLPLVRAWMNRRNTAD